MSACGSTALVESNSDASSQPSSFSSHSETTNLDIGSQEQQSDVVSDTSAFSLDDLPVYSGSPYVAINNNVPYFSESDFFSTTSFETYSDLDALRRCGAAYANVGQDLRNGLNHKR